MNMLTRDVLDNDELLMPSEVAAMFRVDPKTVGRWARSGRVPCIFTPGGHCRFRKSVIAELLELTKP
jgi:excisionase family DNA binding protein